ncbi:MAG: HlyD family efflux transporter periplasmic adaptor subunit [Anaerolineae bacterium]|nr:MAG: HlyD family efflux transporter periplasmic adaptor subunit [Anaerolineae bacterium]
MRARLEHVRKYARIIVPVAILAIALIYLISISGARRAALRASGTIEAQQVTLASERGGLVIEVLVNEGDLVEEGQALVRFDDALLQTQRRQAAAALVQAEASRDLLAMGGAPNRRGAAVAGATIELLAAQQALQSVLDNQNLTAGVALERIGQAELAIRNAENQLATLEFGTDQADIDAARASVVLAADRLDKARENYAPYENKSEDNVIRASLLAAVAEAESLYDAALRRYNNLTGTATDYDLHLAQAALEKARAQLELARADRTELLEGPDPDALALAQARLEAAQAQLALADGTPSPEELAIADAQVEAAAAALAALDVQIEKAVVRAPAAGTVLYRAVEPGEVATPGAPLVTLADLTRLTLTVYLPEDLYGAVNLGQEVTVSVDSFPDEEFVATVIRIADEAEFTPRNVQTVEGRKTTVFAIELSLAEHGGMLKPGMPADVDFED